MSPTFLFLMQFAVLAYAFVGGVFLAFSDFIMRSLARTDGTAGVETMQVINREVFRWIFMALFLGLAPLSLAIAVQGGIAVGGTAGTVVTLAGLVYLVGCFGVTVRFNVPMNRALDGMDVSADATRAYWVDTYLPRGTFWNTVRTAACGMSAALLLSGLGLMVQSQVQPA